MATLPEKSPQSTIDTTIELTNLTDSELVWEWLDFDGAFVRYATLAPQARVTQPTYAEHIWVLRMGEKTLGWFPAPSTSTVIVVR